MNKSKAEGKKQGPIRTGVVVPFAIVAAVIILYFTLFFDHHLRKAFELIGGHVNGAEVNVGSVKTSFWNASFLLQDLQMTDYDQPARNKIRLGEIHFQMLWNALLRAKFVIKEASILGIELDSPRKSPGRILKKPDPPKDPNAPGAASRLQAEALKTAEKQFKGNALADITGLLGGADPAAKLKDIQNQLASVAKAEALQNELKEKQKLWDQRLKALPDNKAIDDLKKRLQSVEMPKDFKDVNKVKAAAEKIQAILKDSESQLKQVQQTATGLTSDLDTFQSAIKGLDALAKKDLEDIQSKIQLPKLEPKEIAKSIFGQMLLARLSKYQRYFDMARKYMPTKKNDPKEVSSIEPPARAVGRSYQFGRPRAFPLFWLQHSAISSVASPSQPLSGNLRGDLRNVTTDPAMIGGPLTLTLAGGFPGQKIMGLDVKLLIDHTTDQPIESLMAAVASFPVQGQSLADSEQIKLGFASAQGASRMMAQLKGQELHMQLNNVFSQVDYSIKAQNELAETTLKNILKEVPRVTLDATIDGSWNDLRIDINSNLGFELQKGLERQIQGRINEAKAQIQAAIDKNLKGKKDELQAQFNKTQSQVSNAVKDKQGKINENKKLADNKSKESQNAGKKGLDQLKKQFGF